MMMAPQPAAGVRQARLQGYDILCISSIDWSFIWQGHQEIMSTLAADGNRVLFVENTGVRTPTIRDLPRLRDRVRNWRRGTKGFRRERENLFVYSPLVFPFPYSWWARQINRAILRRALQRWMRVTGFGRPIVWTFLPTPLAAEIVRDVDPALTVYYCIDDLASSSHAARRIRVSEEKLFREADLVFATSEKLRARAASFSERVHLFPFGVSYTKFERVRLAPNEIPDDVRTLGRPVVGYVGGVHQWVDFELLDSVAARLPHAQFVVVGPLQADTSALAKRPNMHLLGERPHDDLPRYVKAFDVGIVPYRVSEYTANVYPTKLNEYLAMGVPVVATDLPEIRRFNAAYGDAIAVARDVDGWVDAIEKATGRDSRDERDRRVAVARANSWDIRIAEMSALIADALQRRAGESEGWEKRLRRLYVHARRRLAVATLVLVFLYVALFATSLPWVLAEPLRISQPPTPADAIVVFAGGVGESGKAGGGYQERVKQAVDLYRAGLAPRMIFSSGYEFAFPEAQVMFQLAAEEGVPASAIVLETKAANTFENVTNVRAILRARGWRRVLLVSSPYHMRRAMLVWKKQAPDVQVVSSPVPQSQFYTHSRGASLEQIRGLLNEYAAIAGYWWRGWL